MKKRLAVTKDGQLTYCSATEENIGKGRCNHVGHQLDSQTAEGFLESLNGNNPEVKVDSEINGFIIEIDQSTGIEFTTYSSIENDSRKEQIVKTVPLVTLEDRKLTINQSRLEEDSRGVQHKGPILIKDSQNNIHMKYIKLDEINMKTGLYALDAYDYQYPSISEDICSAFLENITPRDSFSSLHYSFQAINNNGQVKTGVVSDNYLYGGSEHFGTYEQYLSIEDNKIQVGDDVKVKHEDFVKNVIDTSNNQQILDFMINSFEKYGVEKEEAKQFIIQQAAYDLIIGNTDRKGNSTNFIFLIDEQTGKTTPYNIDYGRGLVSGYGEKYESTAQDQGFTEEDFKMDAELAISMSSLTEAGGIFGGSTGKLKETVDFLFDNGFQPFEVDRQALDSRLKTLEDKVDGFNIGISNFTKVKTEMLRQMMNDSQLKRLWVEK